MAGGVIDTLKIIYAIDVADNGTKPLLASERAVQKGVAQTAKALAQKDAATKRSAQIAGSAATQTATAARTNVAAVEHQTAAVKRGAAASGKAASDTEHFHLRMRKSFAGLTSSVTKYAVETAAAYASIEGARNAIETTLQLGETTLKLSKTFGLATDQASRYAGVLQARGVDASTLTMNFKTLSTAVHSASLATDAHSQALDQLQRKDAVRIAQATQDASTAKNQEAAQKSLTRVREAAAMAEANLSGKSGANIKIFQELGISQADLTKHGNDLNWVINQVADGMERLPGGTDKASIAAKLFGRNAQAMALLVGGGSEKLKEQLALADKWGVTLNSKTAPQLKKANEQAYDFNGTMLGLKVTVGTLLIPVMTKVEQGFSKFVAQARDGTGAGGQFAHAATVIAHDLKPLATGLESVGKLLMAHPGLVLAAASAYGAFKAAKGIAAVVNDLRAIKLAIIAVQTTAARSSIASGLASGLDTIAGTHWGSLGTTAGTAFGRTFAVGAVVGIATIPLAISRYIGPKILKAIWPSGDISGFMEQLKKNSPLGGIESLAHKLGFHEGGIVGRYQGGGLVPIMASGGEMMIHGGMASMIPGPSDRDGTPMLAPAGAAILTGSGQAMMSMGASVSQALAMQAPHFAKGGVVPGQYMATSYGPPWGGIQGTGVTKTGVNLKDNPHLYGIATDPSLIPLGSNVFAYPNPFGYTGKFSAFDTGSAIKGHHIDFYDWRGRKRQNQWGRRDVTISSNRIAPKGDSGDTYRAPGGGGAAATVSILGKDPLRGGLLGDDASAQGRAAGQAGLTLSQIKKTGDPVYQAIIDAMNGAGTQPDKGDTATKFTQKLTDFGGYATSSHIGKMFAKASAIDAQHYPYAWGGGHQHIGTPSVGSRTSRGGKRALGYDCSGAVDSVLAAGGLLKAPVTSGGLMNWGKPGTGKRVTVYADAQHTIMKLAGKYFGTSESNPNGGAGWISSNTMKGRGVARTWPGMRAGGIVGDRTAGTVKHNATYYRNRFGDSTGKGYRGFYLWLKYGAGAQTARRVTWPPAAGVWSGLLNSYFTPQPKKWPDTDAWRTKASRWDRFRAGGRVRRFASGGTVGSGRELTSGLSSAMTFAGGTFKALDSIIDRAASARLSALRAQVSSEVQAGGSKIVITRLRGVLDLIDKTLGFRVGRIEDVVDSRSRQLDRAASAADRAVRVSGVPTDSSTAIGYMASQNAAATTVLKQNVTSLSSALKTAGRTHNQEMIRDLTQKLQDAQDAVAESLTKQVEMARDQIRVMGTEAVNKAGFAVSLTQGASSGLDAAQRLAGTTDTAAGMRQKAGYINGGEIPALQQQITADKYNAQLLASIGDVQGFSQAVLDAQSATTDLANAQADAADLLRQAAEKEAQDRVDAATHTSTLADAGLTSLELQQQIAGTYDSASAGQSRADYIRQQILPDLQAEVEALVKQRAAAQSVGDSALADQIAEAIAGKQNDILQSTLDATQQVAENTDPKSFGGSTSFSYQNQQYTDLDVMAARMGA